MALAPVMLQRVIWVTLPTAFYFALQGIQALNHGSAWSAGAYAAMAALVAATPFLAKGRVLAGRPGLTISYLAVGIAGVVAWLAAPAPAVRAIGFTVAVLTQVAAAVAARRGGTEASHISQLRDDSAVELGLSGGPANPPLQPTSGETIEVK